MKTNFSILLAAMVVFSLTASCSNADTESDKGRYSYAIGYNIGSNIKQENIDLDIPTFISAIEDALDGKESSMTPEETQQAMQNLMMTMQQKQMQEAETQKKEGESFLEENKKKDGVETTASGLQYRVIEEGSGQSPSADDVVQVHYSGRFVDGSEFDSSYERGEPVQFRLNQVIKGWAEGVQLMKKGSKYELVVPSDLGYGPQGHQGIPGNAVLIFEVELLDILDEIPQQQQPQIDMQQ